MGNKFKYIFFILVLTATLGQFFSDLYLPSLEAISNDLNTSIKLVQLTITLYMLGYSFSALIYGPMSDTIGRKKTLIIGLCLCLIGSTICSFSNNIFMMIIGRLFQGLGGGVGLSVTQAIVRDSTKGPNLAKFNSYLALANITVIISAPILGGYIQEFLNWKANFDFLLFYSILIAVLVVLFVPETKAKERRIKFEFSVYRNSLLVLLRSKKFVGCQICLFSLYGGIMAWMTAGPVLLIKYLGLSPGEYGWTCCICGVAYMCGSLINSQLVLKTGIAFMLNLGKVLMLITSLLLIALSLVGLFNFYSIVIPIMFFMTGGAMFFPNTYASALTPFGRISGFASSFLVASQIFGGFISSFIVAMLPADSQIYLGFILLFSSITVIISSKILVGKV